MEARLLGAGKLPLGLTVADIGQKVCTKFVLIIPLLATIRLTELHVSENVIAHLPTASTADFF